MATDEKEIINSNTMISAAHAATTFGMWHSPVNNKTGTPQKGEPIFWVLEDLAKKKSEENRGSSVQETGHSAGEAIVSGVLVDSGGGLIEKLRRALITKKALRTS